MVKRIASIKTKYQFVNKINLGTTYCTPKELQIKTPILRKELLNLLNGEIEVTKCGWSIKQI